MTSAVIVSTARTPLAQSWKGAFNMTHGATLGSFAVKAAVERAGIDPGAVEDVLMGCANPEGATGMNIARQIALRAGLPITVSGTTINRFYSPTDDAPDFAALAWTRQESAGAVTLRAVGLNDVYQAGNPARWLVILVDAERRVRVDLFLWRSAYSLDAGLTLARSVAASARPNAAALAAYFAGRPTDGE